MGLNDGLFADCSGKILSAQQVTIAATGVAQRLVSASTPCSYVWVAAPYDATGSPTNTVPVFIGDATAQPMALLPDDCVGYYIRIPDAYDLYIKGTINNKVSVLIFG